MHHHRDHLATETPHINDHTDQSTSATTHTSGTTPQVKMHQKTIGPLTARHHLYLDN
uniref:Uncharacterized protein n=1 Tax=Romanomermis culicivorax TaxID=13658 RepID=A0A915HHX6_ROMCU